MKTPALAAIAVAVAFAAVPALGQNDSGNPPPDPAPTSGQAAAANSPKDATQSQPPVASKSEVGTATITPTGLPPSERNPLLTDNGDVRIGKLIGTGIYNKDDKKIGSVDDVLANQNGQVRVVVATGDKKVLLSWDKLQFGDAKLNSDNKVLILDETQGTLNKMPTFTYKNQGNKS